jgi:Arc/MetJ family transcription regulator
MRTNIVVDDSLVAQAMELTGIHTKRGVIDLALRTLIRLHQQRAVLSLEGTVTWEGDLEKMREARIIPDQETNGHGNPR